MSIIKHPEQRVGVFIDAQNLYHTARNLYGRYVHFGHIVEDVVAGRKLIRAVAYVINSEGEGEQNFFDALTKLGIETRVKDLQVFAGGAKKADWDVGMAVDAISLASKLDAVVLVTGDGDFAPLAEYLQRAHGVQVEVASFGQSTSGVLREVADDFFDLSIDPKRYVLHGGKPAKPTRRR